MRWNVTDGNPALISEVASRSDVGLGDLVEHAATGIGIRPCAGCQKRKAILNRFTSILLRREGHATHP